MKTSRSSPDIGSHSRTALGLAYLLLGQGDSARELLETSERVLAPLGWNPVDAAMTHFALAQALWGQPAEHARALTLAKQAAAGFTQGGSMTRRELAQVKQWLASRQALPRRGGRRGPPRVRAVFSAS